MCENAHYDMIVKIAKVFFPSMIEDIREKLKCRFFFIHDKAVAEEK